MGISQNPKMNVEGNNENHTTDPGNSNENPSMNAKTNTEHIQENPDMNHETNSKMNPQQSTEMNAEIVNPETNPEHLQRDSGMFL